MENAICFDAIGITHDLMFGTVFQDPDNCKELLERILEIQIEEITIVESQKNMKMGISSKGIRIDIYARDIEGNSYDIEMQLVNTGELDLRSRYYHSEMDGYQIRTGQKYRFLKESVVIFICGFDLFSKNRSIYTFESICKENPEIRLKDKRKTVFININGNREGISDKAADLLEYFKTGNPNDDFTKRLQYQVEDYRLDDEWRDNYMTLEMKMDLKYEEGIEKGIQQGIEKGIADGKILSILDLLSELGPIPEELKEKINIIRDTEQLSFLLRQASKAESISEFEETIGNIIVP